MFSRTRSRDVEKTTAAMQTLALTRAKSENPEVPHRPAQEPPQQQHMPPHEHAQEPPAHQARPFSAVRDQPPKPDAATEAELDQLCVEADRFQMSRDYERAERCFRKALAINPKHSRSLCNYAYMLHVGKRDFAKAEELYRRALQIDPNRTATLCNYAYLLHSDKRMQEAKQIFLRARDSNPEHPWVKKNTALFM